MAISTISGLRFVAHEFCPDSPAFLPKGQRLPTIPGVMIIRRALFLDSINRLRRAYRAACAPFEDELKQIQLDADDFQRRVDEGKAQWSDYDEESGHGHDYGDVLWDRRQDADDSLLIVRKTFVIALYHLWERSAQRWMKVKNANHRRLVAALNTTTIVVDEASLDELRMLINCLKHNSEGARKLYALRRDLFAKNFDPDVILPGAGQHRRTIDWAEHVKLTDDNVEGYFRLIQNSGPR